MLNGGFDQRPSQGRGGRVAVAVWASSRPCRLWIKCNAPVPSVALINEAARARPTPHFFDQALPGHISGHNLKQRDEMFQ
jgi:hypothetical protein